MTRRGEGLGLVAILVLAAALRLHAIGEPSFWLDEAYSVRDIGGIAGHNSARPLYFLVMRPWVRLGEGDGWLRLPSALFGVAAVYATYRLARARLGAGTALLAALLLAASPLAVDHSQQARMYMLGLLLGVLGASALGAALARPTWWRALAWSGLRLLAVATAPLNGTLVLADVYLIGRRHRGSPGVLGRFGTAGLVLLLWLPLLARSLFDANIGRATSWMRLVPRPGPDSLLSRLVSLTAGWPVDAWQSRPNFQTAWQTAAYFGFALLVIGLLLLPLRDPAVRRRLEPTAAWCFVPLAAIAVLSWLGPNSVWMERVLVFLAPYVLILLAAGLMALRAQTRPGFGAAALVYCGFLALSLRGYYAAPPREDWKGVAAAVDLRSQPGDRVALVPAFCGPVLNRYLRKRWRGETVDLDVEKGFAPEAGFGGLSRLAARPGRVFVVVYRFGPPGRWVFLDRIDAAANVAWRERFRGLDVYLFDGPARAAVVSATTASGAR